MPTVFDNQDSAYQNWLVSHPRGYVVNARRNLTPSYMVLHTADCHSIRNYTRAASKGAFTERNYVKICSSDLDDLRSWVRQHCRPDGTFSSECSLCRRYAES